MLHVKISKNKALSEMRTAAIVSVEEDDDEAHHISSQQQRDSSLQQSIKTAKEHQVIQTPSSSSDSDFRRTWYY